MLPEPQVLALFIASGWLLNLTPGPDVLCILRHALQSLRSGVLAALGVVCGCLVHVLVASLGLGAVLAASATAFAVVKWAGAAYLLWMGLNLLRSRGTALDGAADQAAAGEGRQAFWRGFLTNALNPKVALFFLAFLPQFIAPGTDHKPLAFLLLGLLFTLNSLPINLGYAWAAVWAARRAGALRPALGWLDRAAGLLFIGFGLRLALSDNPAT